MVVGGGGWWVEGPFSINSHKSIYFIKKIKKNIFLIFFYDFSD
jgi:hypothetical protein